MEAAEGLGAKLGNARNGRANALPNGKAKLGYGRTSDVTLPRYDREQLERQAWRLNTAREEEASATQEAAGSTRRRTYRERPAAAPGDYEKEKNLGGSILI